MAYWVCQDCDYGVTSSSALPSKVVNHERNYGHVMDEVIRDDDERY